MTREEITQLNTDYLNDCESEHEMNELFYFVLELLKHEQESSCPYYIIDEDGHGLCKNHRLEQEPILDKIKAEIEAKCCITVGPDDSPAITLHDVFEIIDKPRGESRDAQDDRE